MQIKESAGAGEGEGVQEDEIDSLTPFLTPQHLLASAQPLYLLTSQDSLDVYHDACSTLQRPYLASTPTPAIPPPPNQRKRHASVGGAGAGASGRGVMELYPVLPASINGLADTGRCSNGETSHNGTTATPPPRSISHQHHVPHHQHTPYHHHHIGRLSLSTNSLRKKSDNDSVGEKKTEPSVGEKKTEPPSNSSPAPPKKAGNSSAWVLNYSPCVEVERLFEEGREPPPGPERTVPSLTQQQDQQPKYENRLPNTNTNNNNDAWRKNYVACVEACVAGGGAVSPVCPPTPGNSNLPPPPDSVVHMYTFGPPVQRRRVGLQQLREEFRRENLCLHHKVPHLFVTSQWQQQNRMSCLYLGYRLFWALYFLVWAVWAWVGSMGYNAPLNLKIHFLLYLTNWSILVLAVDTSLQAINVILHLKKVAEDGEAQYPVMPRRIKVSWVFSNITGAIHALITASYWITVYPNRSDEKLTEIGINTHIMPLVYVLLDAIVAATPRRLLHAYQPALYMLAYTLFNLTYYLCGGLDYLGRPALYPVLDWTRPGSTIGIMCLVLILLVPLLHAVLCGLYATRVKAWRILKISRYVREDDETDQGEEGPQEQKV